MNIEYTKYKSILEAQVVTIHNLLPFFKKDTLDFDMYGNIFINYSDKTKNTPILVAHLDNVLAGERTPIFNLACNKISGIKTGIGFDDKAGIIAIIELWNRIKEHDFRIIFTADEERGGIGASRIDSTKLLDAAYIIELDRKGGKDLIRDSGGTILCSKEFADMFTAYGFKETKGLFTDVNIFKEIAPRVNMVNLSIGYYNPHTDDEYLDIKEFEYIVDCVEDFVRTNKERIEDDEIHYKDKGAFINPKDNYPYGTNSRWDREICDMCGKEINMYTDDYIEDYDGNVIVTFCCDECRREYFDYVGIPDKDLNDKNNKQ